MRIRRNKPTNRREAFASMMWYAPMPGRLDMLPAYGGPITKNASPAAEEDIVFLPSQPTVEEVPVGGSKPSVKEWLGLGKELFTLVNGVWTQVRDRQGRPMRKVVSAPPAYATPAPTNYTPLIVAGGLAVLALVGAVIIKKVL